MYLPHSYASYNWMRRGCRSLLITSTSLSTFRLSSRLLTITSLAASSRPVVRSRQRYTVPNLPLEEKYYVKILCLIVFLAIYVKHLKIKNYEYILLSLAGLRSMKSILGNRNILLVHYHGDHSLTKC